MEPEAYSYLSFLLKTNNPSPPTKQTNLLFEGSTGCHTPITLMTFSSHTGHLFNVVQSCCMGYICCFPFFVKYPESSCCKILCNYCTAETRNSAVYCLQVLQEWILNLTFCFSPSSVTFVYIDITFSLYLKEQFYKIPTWMQPRTFFNIKALHCRDLRAF